MANSNWGLATRAPRSRRAKLGNPTSRSRGVTPRKREGQRVADRGAYRIEPRLLLDSLGIAVLVCDTTGRILYRNAIAKERPFSAKSSIGEILRHVSSASDDVDSEWQCDLERAAAGCPPLPRKITFSNPGVGNAQTFTVRYSRLRSRKAKADARVIVSFDTLPEIDAASQEQELSGRLAVMGRMAQRVAHQLNSPLDGILRYVNLALRVAGESADSKLCTYLAESRSGLMRMMEIIADLLEFSRSYDGVADRVAINAMVEEIIRASAPALESAQIVVALDLQDGGMPLVGGDGLRQAVENLVRNAIDAMPNGGRLTIATGVVGEFVVMRVSDTGVGLPDPPERVFEPFYTTKARGKGTGLGLTICREFVEELQGTLAAAANPNGGAVFSIRIPLSACEEKLDDRQSSENSATAFEPMDEGLHDRT